MKVLIAVYYELLDLWSAPEWLGPRLQAEFPQLQVVQLPNYDRVAQEIADAEVYIGWYLREEQFRHAQRLRWIHSTAAGVHQLMSPALVASDVLVTNSRDVQGPLVAEHALALIFALAKRLPSAMRAQARSEWAQRQIWQERPRQLAGSTLGLIGLGAIGSELARRAAALGMRVVAVREHPEKGSEPAHEVHGIAELDAVLPRCDFVVTTAPLTARTRHMFHAARLALLRPDAFLINVSRGPLLDEAALIQALASGQLDGAALDVFAHEPLAPESPLWKLPNVLITPHTAAVSDKLWEGHYRLIVENMRRFLAGQPLLNPVDKAKGY